MSEKPEFVEFRFIARLNGATVSSLIKNFNEGERMFEFERKGEPITDRLEMYLLDANGKKLSEDIKTRSDYEKKKELEDDENN